MISCQNENKKENQARGKVNHSLRKSFIGRILLNMSNAHKKKSTKDIKIDVEITYMYEEYSIIMKMYGVIIHT